MVGMEFFHVYEANIAAGFAPAQSLYLLAVQMTGTPGEPPGPAVSVADHANLCPHGAVLCAPCDYIPPSWRPQ